MLVIIYYNNKIVIIKIIVIFKIEVIINDNQILLTYQVWFFEYPTLFITVNYFLTHEN